MRDADERITAHPSAQPVPRIDRPPPPAALVAPGWSQVSRGLAQTHRGLVFGLVAAVALTLHTAALLFARTDGMGPGPWEGAFWLGGLLLLIPAGLLTLVGQSALCAAPADSGARGWTGGTVAFSSFARALTVLLLIVGGPLVLRHGLPAAPQEEAPGSLLRFFWPLVGAVALAILAEVVFTMLTVRALAYCLGCVKLAQRAGGYIRFFLTFVALAGVLLFFAGPVLSTLPGDPQDKAYVAGTVVLGLLVCFLVLFAQYHGVVSDAHDAVAARVGPPTTVRQ